MEVFHCCQDLPDHYTGILLCVDPSLQDPVKELPAGNTAGTGTGFSVQVVEKHMCCPVVMGNTGGLGQAGARYCGWKRDHTSLQVPSPGRGVV